MSEPVSFDVAADEFLRYLAGWRDSSPATVRAYRADLHLFRVYLAEAGPLPALGQITRPLVMRFALEGTTGAPATRRRRIACLSSFFGFAEDMAYLPRGNPARDIPLPRAVRRLPRGLTREELRRLLVAAERPRDRAIVLLLATAGLRRAEVTGLRLDALDLGHAEIRVLGKGGKERLLPIVPAAVRAIRVYLEARARLPAAPGNPYLFVGQSYNSAHWAKRVGGRLSGVAVNRMLWRLAARAGLERARIHPHAFRHAFATWLVQGGTDLRTVQELLGHANLQTTMVYLHPDGAGMRAAVQRLARLLPSAPSQSAPRAAGEAFGAAAGG